MGLCLAKNTKKRKEKTLTALKISITNNTTEIKDSAIETWNNKTEIKDNVIEIFCFRIREHQYLERKDVIIK